MPRRIAVPLAIGLFCLTTPALAVDTEEDDPPVPTETTTVCEDGLIWDPETQLCVAPTEESGLSDDILYDAVREFAYARQFDNALAALDAMADQTDDRVLTYRGFLARSMGDMAAGMAYYNAALEANPDNLLARSYMGQAFVLMGDIEQAQIQLAEIEARGGAGTWPERALHEAIETKVPSHY